VLLARLGFAVLLVCSGLGQDSTAMKRLNDVQGDFGKPNPRAPKELEQFAFLIGRWQGDSSIKLPDGKWSTYKATLIGRYILDGYVIADEVRQFGPAGELTKCGQNYRSYNTNSGWVMKWQDALNSTWLDLGPPELGGVVFSSGTFSFKHHLPPGPVSKLFPAYTLFQIRIFDISQRHFSWRAEVSTDGGLSWSEVQKMEFYREE
jgi:hypothetical protein